MELLKASNVTPTELELLWIILTTSEGMPSAKHFCPLCLTYILQFVTK